MRRPARVPTLPLVLGFTDGLLNALTLAAGAIVGSGAPIGYGLALRVGVAALVTAAFTMAVADYADRRAELVRASHELNLTVRGRLIATRLGRRAVAESVRSMAIAALASFLGALLPLLAGALLPRLSWLVIVFTIGALAALGTMIAGLTAGSRARWGILMALGGGAVTLIGIQLHIT